MKYFCFRSLFGKLLSELIPRCFKLNVPKDGRVSPSAQTRSQSEVLLFVTEWIKTAGPETTCERDQQHTYDSVDARGSLGTPVNPLNPHSINCLRLTSLQIQWACRVCREKRVRNDARDIFVWWDCAAMKKMMRLMWRKHQTASMKNWNKLIQTQDYSVKTQTLKLLQWK